MAQIAIRPAREDEGAAIALVHDACWRATYTGMVPDAVIVGSRLADRGALWAALLRLPVAARCAHVAEDAGRIVGCTWGGPEESGDPLYRAELLGLYLLRDYRGRGLGRALLGAAVSSLRAQGHRNLLLWALADNAAALGFYRALGGEPLRERDGEMRGFPIREVAYGWPDSAPLVRNTGADR
jgi:ribosomal protein S18 acetylase RimI-like enzyme